MAKSKSSQPSARTAAGQLSSRQQLVQARQAHAKGAIGTEDYIWVAMQCYAAEVRAGRR